MKKNILVRGVTIGEGKPKICVPLVSKDRDQLIEEVQQIKQTKADIVEWRMDYYENVENIDVVLEILTELRDRIPDMPLLATFRSKKEGGEKELSINEYVELNKAVISSEKVDIVDIEFFTGDEVIKDMVTYAHNNNVKVIISNHDFNKTPSKEEIVNRLCKMQGFEADLPKIAVMPQSIDDVLTLLSATNEMMTRYADRPIITMSMSKIGVVSRLAGELFGSAVTFGAVKDISAPGQMSVDKLSNVLNIIHESL